MDRDSAYKARLKDEIGHREYDRLVVSNRRLRDALGGITRALESERNDAVRAADWGSPEWEASYEAACRHTDAKIGALLLELRKEVTAMIDHIPVQLRGYHVFVAMRDLRNAMDELFDTAHASPPSSAGFTTEG